MSGEGKSKKSGGVYIKVIRKGYQGGGRVTSPKPPQGGSGEARPTAGQSEGQAGGSGKPSK